MGDVSLPITNPAEAVRSFWGDFEEGLIEPIDPEMKELAREWLTDHFGEVPVFGGVAALGLTRVVQALFTPESMMTMRPEHLLRFTEFVKFLTAVGIEAAATLDRPG